MSFSCARGQVVRGPAGIIGSGALGEVRRGLYRGVEVALKGLHMLRTDAASVSLSCPAARAAATGTRRSLGERDGSGLNFVMTLSKQSIAQSVDPSQALTHTMSWPPLAQHGKDIV